jgi:DEAD/DEAH box helicase
LVERRRFVDQLSSLLAVAKEEEPGLEEVRRVCRIRLERKLLPEEAEEISRVEVDPLWFSGQHPLCERDRKGEPVPFRLRRQQAQFIHEFDAEGGAVVSTRTGSGKTLMCFLAAKHSHAPAPRGRGIRRSLLIVPSGGVSKLWDSDRKKAERILGFSVPMHALFGLSPAKRLKLARSGLPGVYCTTFALLSRPGATDEIDAIKPELVVVDEAHTLSNESTNSATKKRFRRMLEMFRPLLVALSGTLGKKSFLDTWPFFVFALRERAPVPLQSGIAEFWAAVLDAKSGVKANEEILRSMDLVREWTLDKVRKGLIDPAEVGGPLSPDAEGIRRAFRVRRNNAPGVIALAEGEVGTSLKFANTPCFEAAGAQDQESFDARVDTLEAEWAEAFPAPLPEEWVPREIFAALPPLERMLALIWAVRDRSRTPNGDEIEHAMLSWRPQFELAAGFYNELVWPTGEQVMKARGVTAEEADRLLKAARKHHEAVQSFVAEMRDFFKGDHLVGLDTPLLVWGACDRHDKRLPKVLYEKWLRVKGRESAEHPERIAHKKRVCDWKIRAAVKWARGVETKHGQNTGGLVWCMNREIQHWAREVFTAEFGEDRVLFCPATTAADAAISDPESGKKWTVASVGRHHKIKDLPHFEHQCLVQVPRDPNVMEQLLGRTLRTGQQADELRVVMFNTLAFDTENYYAMLLDAMWLQQAEAQQKVIVADYDPFPRYHPDTFLQERGYNLISMNQDAALRMALGGDS